MSEGSERVGSRYDQTSSRRSDLKQIEIPRGIHPVAHPYITTISANVGVKAFDESTARAQRGQLALPLDMTLAELAEIGMRNGSVHPNSTLAYAASSQHRTNGKRGGLTL